MVQSECQGMVNRPVRWSLVNRELGRDAKVFAHELSIAMQFVSTRKRLNGPVQVNAVKNRSVQWL